MQAHNEEFMEAGDSLKLDAQEPAAGSLAPSQDATVVVKRGVIFDTVGTPKPDDAHTVNFLRVVPDSFVPYNKEMTMYKDGEEIKNIPARILEAEKKYPMTCSTFRDIQDEQYNLFCGKMLDYSPANIMLGGNVDVEADRTGALRGIVIRMNDKMQRLLTIIVKGSPAHNESALDSFKDMSVYSIIAQIVDRKRWGR